MLPYPILVLNVARIYSILSRNELKQLSWLAVTGWRDVSMCLCEAQLQAFRSHCRISIKFFFWRPQLINLDFSEIWPNPCPRCSVSLSLFLAFSPLCLPHSNCRACLLRLLSSKIQTSVPKNLWQASRHTNLTETLGVLFTALWASIESFRLARAPVEY